MAKSRSVKSKRVTRKDPYFDALGKVWPYVVRTYDDFKDEKPIIVYELPRRMVYAYPAFDYINDLTERTREQPRQLYKRAIAADEFMVFVHDTKKRVLRSYVFPIREKP